MKVLKRKMLRLVALFILAFTLSGCEVLEIVDFVLTGIIELEESTSSLANGSSAEIIWSKEPVASIADGSLTEVHFIDSGNSDSILLKNNGRFALIDELVAAYS